MRESAYAEILQGFMDHLASINGVTAPKFDKTGLCVLGDDSAPVMLQIFEERNQLVFLSPIAVLLMLWDRDGEFYKRVRFKIML